MLEKLVKELVFLCRKETYFVYEDGIYKQSYDVAVELSLSPILVWMFMVKGKTIVLLK